MSGLFKTFAVVIIPGAFCLSAQTVDHPLKVGNGVSAPVPIKHVNPSFTGTMVDRYSHNEARVHYVVDVSGTPRNITFVRRVNPAFDLAVSDCLKQWRFKPAMFDGEAVAVELDMSFSFDRR